MNATTRLPIRALHGNKMGGDAVRHRYGDEGERLAGVLLRHNADCGSKPQKCSAVLALAVLLHLVERARLRIAELVWHLLHITCKSNRVRQRQVATVASRGSVRRRKISYVYALRYLRRRCCRTPPRNQEA